MIQYQIKEKEYDFEISKVFTYDAALAIFIDKSELNELLNRQKEMYNCIISDEVLDIDEQFITKQITRDDIMYIMTKLVIDKNALSISYMKVFGYEGKEIRKLYLTATTFVVVVSLIVCIPLEIALFKGTLEYLSSMIEGYLKFYLPTYVYFEIVVIGIVAYMCINALHVYNVKNIPMTEALKNRE